MARVYCFMADYSSKMSLSWMVVWNTAVRRTIRWLGGGWGLAVEMLVELLVEVLVGMMVEALVAELVEALIEALVELLVEAVVTSSRASLRLRTWLVCVLQVKHPCYMQREFLRQVF